MNSYQKYLGHIYVYVCLFQVLQALQLHKADDGVFISLVLSRNAVTLNINLFTTLYQGPSRYQIVYFTPSVFVNDVFVAYWSIFVACEILRLLNGFTLIFHQNQK